MPNTFSFEEALAPARPASEAATIRAGMSGPMGASNAELDREESGTRESLAQVTDPEDRQNLQDHLDAIGRNRSRAQPGEPKATFSFEEATAQKPLPADVKPSTAGAGRGSVNPPAEGPPPPVTADAQGDPMGSGAADIMASAQGASSPSSGSIAKDLAVNVGAGLAKGALGFGATAAQAVGAESTAKNLDDIRQNWQNLQQENGGDTVVGKAADLVGAVAPAMLLPGAKAAQIIGNAGLFAIPAFRDTLKSQIEAGRSFPLAMAHAAEAFGINLFMPTVATKGSAAVTKALGAEGAQGVKAAAVQGAQAAGEGAAFSAANSVLDKGTDKAAQALGDDTAQNDHDWIDLKDIAANALGFTTLRAAHLAPQAVSAIADRVGSPSRQVGRAMEQDVQDAQFGPADEAASRAAGVTLNPNLATQPEAKSTATPNVDIAAQLQAIRPLQDRAKKLREAGEDVVADELDRRANTQAADIELQAHPDADPAFQGYYRTLRADGAMPAEASARAGMLGAFEQTAQQAGITPNAIDAAMEKATKMPLAKVPQFLDTYVSALNSAGMGSPAAPRSSPGSV